MQPVVFPKMRTPWGSAQSVSILAPGIGLVHTAGHGGIKCNRATNAAIPLLWRQPTGWYEEDCECAIPLYFHATLLDLHAPIWLKDSLKKYPPLKTLKTTFWRKYEIFFQTTLEHGQSHAKDEHLFFIDHANDLIACSAFGDCFPNVPAGQVALVARPGGHRGDSKNERWFLVPQKEYALRSGPFLIDLSTHTEVPPINAYGPPNPRPMPIPSTNLSQGQPYESK